MQKSTSYSKIIAGTMSWGAWGKKFSKPQIIDLLILPKQILEMPLPRVR